MVCFIDHHYCHHPSGSHLSILSEYSSNQSVPAKHIVSLGDSVRPVLEATQRHTVRLGVLGWVCDQRWHFLRLGYASLVELLSGRTKLAPVVCARSPRDPSTCRCSDAIAGFLRDIRPPSPQLRSHPSSFLQLHTTAIGKGATARF